MNWWWNSLRKTDRLITVSLSADYRVCVVFFFSRWTTRPKTNWQMIIFIFAFCVVFFLLLICNLSLTHTHKRFFSLSLSYAHALNDRTQTRTVRESEKNTNNGVFAMSSQPNTHIRGIKRLTQHTNTCERIPRTITTTTKTRCSLQQYKFWFKWLARIRNCEFFGKNLTQSKIRTHLSRLFFLCLWQNGLCLAYLFLIASHLQCSKWSESEKELRPKKKNRTNVRRPNLIGYL